MHDIKKKCMYTFCNNILYHHVRWLLDGKGLRLWLKRVLGLILLYQIIVLVISNNIKYNQIFGINELFLIRFH
jgi:hypothetical protein